MRLAASCKPRASSFKSGNQTIKHFVDLFDRFDPFCTFGNIAEFFANQNHCFKFLQRPKANTKATSEIQVGTSSVPFSNIRRNRDRGTLHLRTQPKFFRLRKCICQAINSWAELQTLLPHLQILKIRSPHYLEVYLDRNDSFASSLAACRFSAGGSHR